MNQKDPLPELVRQLAERIALTPETPLEVAASLGTIAGEHSSWIDVTPSDPRFSSITVSLRSWGDPLGNVQLNLTLPGSLTTSELAALWGPPAIPPSFAVTRTSLAFSPPPPPAAAFRSVVTVVTDGDEKGPVLWVQVIRDIL